ncbi:unnamed protein product [Haemonchus placei]|uniref:Uncharacterized protein n=1 Tax=Haemonchus placei TaxID=6290 RepID=A0A0N4WYA9_HAEPC|nr:unnamed protein product [Haemonchus placei]
MAESAASEDAKRTLNHALVAGGEPVHQAAMGVDMAEASGAENADGGAQGIRLEDEYEAANAMHFFHVKFLCDGQPFPALDGRAAFPLETCRCSRNTFVKDILSEVVQPAC